ncbi:hypothetical protein CHUAL_007396 [Chamberlinius hualienensis]
MASTYVKDDSGATFIPATQRPDGTWRKARRVKDGYVPQEEVPLYESKGKQWAKAKPTLPPGLSQIDMEKVKTATVESAANKSSNKKKKKSDTNSTVNQQQNVDHLSKKLNATHISGVEAKKGTQPTTTDPVKKLKNLKKKLREIDALKEKIESGALANPDKDQLEKVSRRDQVAREIEDLELGIDE